MPQVQGLKGFADLFGKDAYLFVNLEEKARQLFALYSYEELRTPLLEATELFAKSIGEETDVVGKEMYTFQDKGQRSVTLRPEATAGVLRAFIESKMYNSGSVYKFFSTGPMFRYERPQKGRMRQFHQINCECLGAKEPETDGEMICMLNAYLRSLGIDDFMMNINSLGCPECRPKYKQALTKWLRELDTSALCEDCLRRLETNPLRVLDCKVPTCIEHTKDAPQFADYYCEECKEHFGIVKSLLEKAQVPFVVNPKLVRGLDYYVRTTFEAVSTGIGAQSSIAGGGRYDGLIKQLGGPDISGIGFACGMERLALLAKKGEMEKPYFYLAVIDEKAREQGFLVAQSLRAQGIKGEYGFGARSLKSHMRQADKSQTQYALLLGGNEVEKATIIVKNMSTGEQTEVPVSNIADTLLKG